MNRWGGVVFLVALAFGAMFVLLPLVESAAALELLPPRKAPGPLIGAGVSVLAVVALALGVRRYRRRG